MIEKEHRANWSIADTEAELARARLLFDQELREATVVGTRAARRFIVPALWGIALLGGGLALLVFTRLTRRRPSEALVVRVVVEHRWSAGIVVPALGAAVARAAARRWLPSAAASLAARLHAPALGDRQRGKRGPGAASLNGFKQLDAQGAEYDSTANGQLETID